MIIKKLMRLLHFKLVVTKRKRSRQKTLWSNLMTNERKIRELLEDMVRRNKYVSTKSKYKITLSKPRQIIYLYKQNQNIRDELRKYRNSRQDECKLPLALQQCFEKRIVENTKRISQFKNENKRLTLVYNLVSQCLFEKGEQRCCPFFCLYKNLLLLQ